MVDGGREGQFCWRQARTVKSPWSITFRARHQPDFEWRVERKSYTVNPVEEYTPKIVISRR
jgi:hypothetical protein